MWRSKKTLIDKAGNNRIGRKPKSCSLKLKVIHFSAIVLMDKFSNKKAYNVAARHVLNACSDRTGIINALVDFDAALTVLQFIPRRTSTLETKITSWQEIK